jgi:hypothetical protein
LSKNNARGISFEECEKFGLSDEWAQVQGLKTGNSKCISSFKTSDHLEKY